MEDAVDAAFGGGGTGPVEQALSIGAPLRLLASSRCLQYLLRDRPTVPFVEHAPTMVLHSPAMSAVTKHVPGSFCWFELATTDQNAAKQFYQSVFGWKVEDQAIGPSETYSMFRIDGKDVAAGYRIRPEQLTQGVPPHWMIYMMVANADASAAKAKALGAAVIVEPFDVMDHGKMSVIRDPTGAMFCIWQPNTHTGTGLTGAHGTMVWADLSTPDQKRAGEFYSALFGWTMVTGTSMNPAKPGEYYHIMNGSEFIGGVQPAEYRDPHIPAHWLMYFDVANCDKTVARVASLAVAAVSARPRSSDRVDHALEVREQLGSGMRYRNVACLAEHVDLVGAPPDRFHDGDRPGE